MAPIWSKRSAHCGECHTPRNLLQALDNRFKFAGETEAGWRAYNITADRASGIGQWSDADLASYLASGHANLQERRRDRWAKRSTTAFGI